MDYIVDVETKRLVSSFLSTRTTTPESAVFGDTPDITVRLVESNDDGVDLPWRYVDLTGYSIRVAIGNPGGDPTSGTFTLTFDGDTTAALNYNATAAEIDTELNGLASMVTAGGCTVSAVSAGYQVAFDTVGAQNTITATTDSLFPASSAYIYEATTGDGSTNEVQVVTLEVDNAAYVELTTDITAPSATVTTVREGVTDTTSELQRVEIDGDPYLGTWAVTIGGNTSAAISVDATIAEITTAIEGITGIGAGNVVVTGSVLDFTIQFAASLGNVGTAAIDVANLTGALGKTGSIDLNTNQFLELLGGAASASSTLEIVKYDTGNSTSDTVLQQAITCRQDVIPDTPASATPFPTYAASSHTHLEASITDLGTAVTLNADTNISANGWFLDTDTLAENDAEKVPSQQSVKAYVDTQIAGLGSSMVFLGSYDANTTDPTDGDVGGTYVVTVAGTGVASFWSTALEIGDVIIQENATATTEADWVVVSKDLDAAAIKTLYESNADTNEFSDAEQTLLATIETNADVTDETNVTAALDGATLTAATVAGTDKVLVQDTDAADELKTVTAQSIADLGGSGTPEGTAILSTGETGGTKYLREDGDGTCSWQTVAGGDLVDDTTPQLGGMLDVNGQAIGDGTLELITFTETGSAVNHVNITNATTGNAPEVASAGDDTNTDLAISAKGTGEIIQTAKGIVQSNGDFATAGDAQAMTYVLRGTTSNATFTEIFLNGSSTRMVLPYDTTWAFDALIVARLGTQQASAAYNVFGCIDNESGTVAMVGSVQYGTPIEDNPLTNDWDVQFTADDTNDSLKLEVKGGTGHSDSVRWVASVRVSQVTNDTSSSY